jgi:thiol-disulfide isomerase/thioredoxin
MKKVLFFLSFFVFTNANSQAIDSVEEIEKFREINESMFANVVGKALPAFVAKDSSGNSYSSDTVRSRKVTFFNLWFTACPPCIAEIPNLNRLYDLLKDSADFQFFSITWEQEARAKETIRKYGIRYPVLFVSPTEARLLTFGRGYPTNMIIDNGGIIRWILSGGSSKSMKGLESYWKQEIEKLLGR